MYRTKIVSVLIVLGIIVLIIFSGPANAIIVKLDIPDKSIDRGEIVKFIASIELEDRENIKSVEYISLNINKNNEKFTCNFKEDGTIIDESKCIGVEIKKSDNSGTNGYCKNYGYGCKLDYIISVDSQYFNFGSYNVNLLAKVNNKEVITELTPLLINIPDKICSIRASEGILNIENKEFIKNNKLNFYMPIKHAVKGEGYITGQKDKERFSYRFNIDQVILNDKTKLKIKVSGKYKLSNTELKDDEAIITYDRIKNTVSIIGFKINLKDMKINFREWC